MYIFNFQVPSFIKYKVKLLRKKKRKTVLNRKIILLLDFAKNRFSSAMIYLCVQI